MDKNRVFTASSCLALIPKSNINSSSTKICKLPHTCQTTNNCFIIRRPPAITTAVSAKQLLFWVFQWNDPIKGCWLIYIYIYINLFLSHFLTGDYMPLTQEDLSAVCRVAAPKRRHHLGAGLMCGTFSQRNSSTFCEKNLPVLIGMPNQQQYGDKLCCQKCSLLSVYCAISCYEILQGWVEHAWHRGRVKNKPLHFTINGRTSAGVAARLLRSKTTCLQSYVGQPP